MSSTLVETVSLNYEDFNDSFLTCGTCLCCYDGAEHTPKLLPCSHTVCRSCLERIIAAARDSSQLRCPICRSVTPLPTGGVGSLPPSFLVNQLLDLMAQQRRDIVPKCSTHPTQELLFCESCDDIFCIECPASSSHGGVGASSHTVIPFSIAIKRLSEILFYKASLCLKNLDKASQVVSHEMESVGQSADDCLAVVNRVFDDLIKAVEARRKDLSEVVRLIRERKVFVLDEQLHLIEGERSKVQAECQGMQQQLEVRRISKKITDLNAHLDTSATLMEPRENLFMVFEHLHNSALDDFSAALRLFGRVRISPTFPALCTVSLQEPVTAHLRSTATITAYDFQGAPRVTGLDPWTVALTGPGPPPPLELVDDDSGRYTIKFSADAPGAYTLSVSIFGRPIKDNPLRFTVSEHHNPVTVVGGRGEGPGQLVQPVRVAVRGDEVFVLDTGNSRVVVLAADSLAYQRAITGPGLEHNSSTGLALVPDTGHLVVSNWRTRTITTLAADSGELVHKFSHTSLQEPIDVAVTSAGEMVVADNGRRCLQVFSQDGELLRSVGEGHFQHITSVSVAANNDILVTDSAIRVFSSAWLALQTIQGVGSRGGEYGGVAVDGAGNLLATRRDKGRSFLVYITRQGKVKFSIDSHAHKLRRPSGLACTQDGHVIVADLGNDQVKKYRFV